MRLSRNCLFICFLQVINEETVDGMAARVKEFANEKLFGRSVLVDPTMDLVILHLYALGKVSDVTGLVMSAFTWERGMGTGLLLTAALFLFSVFFFFFSFADTFGSIVEGSIFLFGVYFLSIDLICRLFPHYRVAHILDSLGDVESVCLPPPRLVKKKKSSPPPHDPPQPLSASSVDRKLQSVHSYSNVKKLVEDQSLEMPLDIPSKKDGAIDVSSGVIHAGYMQKRGKKRKGWRRRYFVLTPGVLSYYKREKDASPSGVIHLSQCQLKDVMVKGGKESFCFELYHLGTLRSYILRCMSSFEKMFWMHDLFHEVTPPEKVLDDDVEEDDELDTEADGRPWENSSTPTAAPTSSPSPTPTSDNTKKATSGSRLFMFTRSLRWKKKDQSEWIFNVNPSLSDGDRKECVFVRSFFVTGSISSPDHSRQFAMIQHPPRKRRKGHPLPQRGTSGVSAAPPRP
jgi:hypothetical protein